MLGLKTCATLHSLLLVLLQCTYTSSLAVIKCFDIIHVLFARVVLKTESYSRSFRYIFPYNRTGKISQQVKSVFIRGAKEMSKEHMFRIPRFRSRLAASRENVNCHCGALFYASVCAGDTATFKEFGEH